VAIGSGVPYKVERVEAQGDANSTKGLTLKKMEVTSDAGEPLDFWCHRRRASRRQLFSQRFTGTLARIFHRSTVTLSKATVLFRRLVATFSSRVISEDR
jgi:hypothetical protein